MSWKSRLLGAAVPATMIAFAPGFALAHPHVFVEAKMEIVLDEKKQFTALNHTWRFDELFSTTIVLDYDDNGNGELDPDELKLIGETVKKSIAEFDFYTAIRSGTKPVEFYEPERIDVSFRDGALEMRLTVEPAKPWPLDKQSLRISASDTTYYVAFDLLEPNMTVSGPSQGCNTEITVPDFDALYAENSQFLTEAFFNNPETPELGDEFYTWVNLSC